MKPDLASQGQTQTGSGYRNKAVAPGANELAWLRSLAWTSEHRA